MRSPDIGVDRGFFSLARMLNRISLLKFCYCAAAALLGAVLGATAPGSWRAAEVAAHAIAKVPADPAVRRGD